MRQTRCRFEWLLLACLAGWVPAAGDAGLPSSGLEERTLSRLVTKRVRIEPTGRGRSGACRGLSAQDLVLSLRGRRLPSDYPRSLDREPQPVLHALLLDTSRSMVGRLDRVREVATAYIARLDLERDRAMLLSFDEDVILAQAPTGDGERLVRALERLRIGSRTAMHDGLRLAIREMDAHRERPVVVLLSDGMDTASLEERSGIHALANARPELTIFTIGFGLPPIQSSGPDGLISTKRFLQNLAWRTNGTFFEVHTGSRLDRAFSTIRDKLDDEATLSFVDPSPARPPGRVKVTSLDPACKVRPFRSRPDAPGDEEGRRAENSRGAGRIRIETAGYRGALIVPRKQRTIDPVCDDAGPGDFPEGFAELQAGRLVGCDLDLTMGFGVLYSTVNLSRTFMNGWPRLKMRRFAFDVPAVDGMPARPEQALDELAGLALDASAREVETDSRQWPVKAHARPYLDVPVLVHGRTFFHIRDALARVMFQQPELGAWVRRQLERATERELAALGERFRSYAPQLGRDELERIVRDSARGRAALARIEHPSDTDVRGYLAAWLGDISAHDLLVRWESLRLARMLRQPEADHDAFQEEWRAVRDLLQAPSYARIVTLLAPVRDVESGRIGFWRVVLPRSAWLFQRVKGLKRHPEFSDLPLDLVPDLGLGHWLIARGADRDPGLLRQLFQAGFRTAGVSYASLQKPHKQDPPRAFEATRVVVVLVGDRPGQALSVTADVRLDRKSRKPSLAQTKLWTPRGALDPDLARRLEAALAPDRPLVATLDELTDGQ